MIIYMMCLVLFSVGIYCILTKRNLIKIIIGVGIVEYAINLFFILIAYRKNGRVPIFSGTQEITDMVDPLPQALPADTAKPSKSSCATKMRPSVPGRDTLRVLGRRPGSSIGGPLRRAAGIFALSLCHSRAVRALRCGATSHCSWAASSIATAAP